jgi:hypothetical protein
MIHFIKILQYQTRPSSGDVFSYVADLAAGKIDPDTLAPGELIFEEKRVFCSPLRRAVNCLKIDQSIQYAVLSELREIPFNLTKSIHREDWEQLGSKIVRKKFKESFVNDSLLLSRAKISKEINNILSIILAHKEPQALVSHSFRLKIIEAFLKTDGQLFQNPELIHSFIKDEEKTYDFGEGFFAEPEKIEKLLK